jgi:predicted permease
MELFKSTANQMVFLFVLIFLGYLLAKLKALPEGTDRAIARLENNLFTPCLILGTLYTNFTVAKLSSAAVLIGLSSALLALIIPISIILPRFFAKTKHLKNIYVYSFAIANFGFMGNSVVSSLFPEIFAEYILFTLPLWIYIYVWGIPVLLMPTNEKAGVKGILKNFLNPMFICLILGILMGLLNLKVPSSIDRVIVTIGDCMSPLAMILTGITISKINLKSVLKNYKIYVASAARLLIIPLCFIGIFSLLDLSDTFLICAMCAISMPFGINTIVIPTAYGIDTSDASGMALISHTLSLATIPFIFWILSFLL